MRYGGMSTTAILIARYVIPQKTYTAKNAIPIFQPIPSRMKSRCWGRVKYTGRVQGWQRLGCVSGTDLNRTIQIQRKAG